MSLVDLIGLGADKQAVIFDIGAAFTKIGFAGEFVPRNIIRSTVATIIDGERQLIKLIETTDRSKEENYLLFKDFFHTIYFRYLLVNPKERRVVISESMLTSIQLRNVIVKVLFNHFEVVSVLFIPSHLLALFAMGLHTGLIVDCGYNETSVVPIYEQFPLLNAMTYIDLAAKAVHQHIKDNIMENAIVQIKHEEKPAKSVLNDISELTFEDIKVRCCFVGRRECNLVATPVKYPIDSDKILQVTGKLRAHAMDVLFEPNDEDHSIATIILDSILECPIDCRKELAEKIVLVGGGVMAKGFESRLYSEIKFLLDSQKYENKLFLKKFSFCKPLVPPNYSSWLGAAMFGALEILGDYSISKERYKVDEKIPDWSSVLSINPDDVNKGFMEDKYKWNNMRKSLSSMSSSPGGSTASTSSVTERLRKELGLSISNK